MRFGSLFSGIEAASAAWLPLGWSCAWVAEIDPFACAVLRHHYPDTPNLGDITKVDWNATEPVDLVVGGPPCQGFSIAGQRGGLSDPRGDLSLAYVDALDAIDPAWSLTENVPGWLSMGDNSFGHFLARLVGHDAPLVPSRGQRWTDSGLAAGPRRTAAWRICDAQYFGVPQRRRRVFVIASQGAGNWACADALFPVRTSVQRDFAPRREAGERTARPVASCAPGGSGYRCDADTADNLIAFSAKDHGADAGDTAPTLRAGGHSASHANAGVMPAVAYTTKLHNTKSNQAGKFYEEYSPSLQFNSPAPAVIAHSLRADGFDAGEDGTGRGTPLVAVDLRNGVIDGDVAQTLQSHHRSNSLNAEPTVMTLAIRGRGDSHDLEYREDGIANAVLTPNGGRAGIGVGAVMFDPTARQPEWSLNRAMKTDGPPAVANGMSVRRLTPVECERLQGLPDGYTDIPYRGGKPASDGPRYRAIGNSMAVPVIAWLGRRIQQFTEQEATDAE